MRFRKKYRWQQKRNYRVLVPPLLLITVLVCILESMAGENPHSILEAVLKSVSTDMGYQSVHSWMPMLAFDASSVSDQKTIYEYLAESMEELLPIYSYARTQDRELMLGSTAYDGLPAGEDSCSDAFTEAMVIQENQKMQEEMDLQGVQGTKQALLEQEEKAIKTGSDGTGKKYSREKLNDFDYLLQHFYRVDSTTTTNSSQLNASEMLKKDMSVDKQVDGPQILIYHTHSQEAYADSKDSSQSVLGLGDYLTQLLEENYGYNVLHHTGIYDLPDRDSAYSRAAPALEKLLKENPSIQVIIDVHRDGVPEHTRLMENINGKDTATIMFFNGLSHTTAQGDIDYLYNPNLADNLAFSFQMQLVAAEKYPGLSKCIYLKGYRYNLHYLPKSLLVEVGAQTNTWQEARNAMEPLADVLNQVLSGNVE